MNNSETKWKSIVAHNWQDDNYYNAALKYLKSNEIPEFIKTPKSKFDFKNKLKYYNVGKNQNNDNFIIYSTQEVPNEFKNNNGQNMIVSFNENIIFKVIKPSERDQYLNNLTDGSNLTELSLSAEKLYHRVVKRNRILGISMNYIKDFLKRKAIHIKSLNEPSKRPIVKSFRPKKPRDHWQIDTIYMRKQKKHNSGYDMILVIIDIFSKYVYLKPLRTNKEDFDKTGKDNKRLSNQVAEYLEKIFLSGDIPRIIQSDNGSEFKDKVEVILKKYNIEHRVSPSYSPQTNGFVENKNKLIKRLLYVHFMSQKQKGIKTFYKYINDLDKISFSINTTVQSVTKLTPISVHFGIHSLYHNNNEIESIVDKKTVTILDDDENEIRETILPLDSNSFSGENSIVPSSNEINSFSISQKKTTTNTNKQVSKKINTQADKAELKNKLNENLDPRIQPKSYVYIKSYYTGSCKLDDNPIYLRYRSKTGKKINLEVPKVKEFSDNKAVKAHDKFISKVYNQVYIVNEKIYDSEKSIPYYTLKPYNPDTGTFYNDIIVERRIQKLEKEGQQPFTKKFYKSELQYIDPFQISTLLKNKQNAQIILKTPIENEQVLTPNVSDENRINNSNINKVFYYPNSKTEQNSLDQKVVYEHNQMKIIHVKFTMNNGGDRRHFLIKINDQLIDNLITKMNYQEIEDIINQHIKFNNINKNIKDVLLGKQIIFSFNQKGKQIINNGIIIGYHIQENDKTIDEPYLCLFKNKSIKYLSKNDILLRDFILDKSHVIKIYQTIDFKNFFYSAKISIKSVGNIIRQATIYNKNMKPKGKFDWYLKFDGDKEYQRDGITLDPDQYKNNNLSEEGDWTFTDVEKMRTKYLKSSVFRDVKP